jgi:hypothetical protein
MLKITQGKGFHMTFENGNTISVQFGAGNYCGNHDEEFPSDIPKKTTCEDAEIAIWDKNGKWLTKEYLDKGDDVLGWLTADEVLKAMIWTANRV